MEIPFFVSILLGTVVAGYLLGAVPIAFFSPEMTGYSGDNVTANLTASYLINKIKNMAIENAGLFLAIAGVLIASIFAGGELVMLLWSSVLFLFVMNLFVLPTSYLAFEGFPIELKVIITLFYNTMLILALLEFIKR